MSWWVSSLWLIHDIFLYVKLYFSSQQGFTQLSQQYKWLCSGISSDNRRRKEIVSLSKLRSRRSNLIKFYNKIQYELIFPLNLLLVPGYICLDYLSNIRSGISEEPSSCSLFSGLLRETWRSVFSLLQVSKPRYSNALETKHMFSSRLLREPTCYLYPVSSRREMTASSLLFAFPLSKISLIKRIKQSVIFSPPYSIHCCAALAPLCVCVCCIWLVSLMPHLHIKSAEPVSCHPRMTTSAT